LDTATYKYCCRGSYCSGCPIEVYFTFAEQKRLVHTGLKLDCQEYSFNTTVDTVLQEGIYAINVSPDENSITLMSLNSRCLTTFAKKKKRNLYQVFIAGNVGYRSLLVTLFHLLMCVRFHMGQKSQCHIYPGLTGKLVKLMSKVRYIIIIWKDPGHGKNTILSKYLENINTVPDMGRACHMYSGIEGLLVYAAIANR